MISRFMHNTDNILRSASLNSHLKWMLNLKCNSWKGRKLFHTCTVSFNDEAKVQTSKNQVSTPSKVIKVWKNITPRELSHAMKINIKTLGVIMPNLKIKPDEPIESLESISQPLSNSGWKFQVVNHPGKELKEKKKEHSIFSRQPPSDPKNLVKRAPVVTIMGHVDHGKTTLLDSLRNTFVAQQEFGGITQHIGAFSVEVKPGERITFIDTPGHAAFTAMRSRGAEVTDLVVLVIAADDGVMEQTIESIKIALMAQVGIVVAVNKIDKPNALPIEEIKQKLLWEGIQVEDVGGDVQLVPISALKKINLDLLTEVILLQAELMNLTGDPTGLVEGVIIESNKGTVGPVATVIVKRGTLRKEKILLAGKSYARVRRMLDENGKDYEIALPSTPVQVLGWRDIPTPGDDVYEVPTEKQAKKIVSQKQKQVMAEKQEAEIGVIEQKAVELHKKHKEFKEKLQAAPSSKERRVLFNELRQQRQREEKEGSEEGPHLKVLLKGDVYGTVEVLMEILGSYNKQDECQLSVVHASVGDVKVGDLEIASSFNAVIYAFNVNLHQTAKDFLQEKAVDIRYHNVLYKLIDDLKEELSARIPLADEEEVHGEAEVLENFIVTHVKKKVPVAGARCIRGQLNKDSLYRILRNNEVLYEGKLLVMKNEKIMVKTIPKGMECGLLFDSFPGKFLQGDKIISYDIVKVPRKTTWDPGF